MSLTYKIAENIKALPESKQMEILDFVEYLRAKIEKEERNEWTDFSLSSAMRGMEEEQVSYSIISIGCRISETSNYGGIST